MAERLIYISGALPRNCTDCPLASMDYNHDIYCPALKTRVSDILNPDRCPLRNLEEHDEQLKAVYTRIGYENGLADGLKAKKSIL